MYCLLYRPQVRCRMYQIELDAPLAPPSSNSSSVVGGGVEAAEDIWPVHSRSGVFLVRRSLSVLLLNIIIIQHLSPPIVVLCFSSPAYVSWCAERRVVEEGE